MTQVSTSSPFDFRVDDLHTPSFRPSLPDVRTLHERFAALRESHAQIVAMLNDAEAEIDILKDHLSQSEGAAQS